MKPHLLFLGVAALGAATLAEAESAVPQPTKEQESPGIQAESRGAQLYAYDQAAWHATDSFRADVERKGLSLDRLPLEWGAEGYVVEPGADETLTTTFFGRKDGQLYAIARYAVSGSAVKSGGLVEGDQPKALSRMAEGMIAARKAAMEAFGRTDFSLCSQHPANTVVLPPDAQGQSAVYILTPSSVTGVYPAGGHFRFDFDATGKLIAQRRFMKGCFDLDTRARADKRPAALVLSHLLDPQPTEIHVFVSYNIPVGLYVATTSSKSLWGITRGKIRFLDRRN